LARCYEAFVNREEVHLPELPVQYVEYAQWQRENITGEVLEKQVAYWKNKLKGAQTVIDLPVDHPRPPIHSWRGATEELIFDSQVLSDLKKLGQQEGGTLFMVTMAAFQALLWRYTGQEAFSSALPRLPAARLKSKISSVSSSIPWSSERILPTTLPSAISSARFVTVPSKPTPTRMSLRKAGRRTGSRTLDGYHAALPGDVHFPEHPKQIFQISGLQMEELEFETGIAKFDLEVELYEDRDFHCRFEYNTDLFDKPTILRTLGHFRNLVNAALETRTSFYLRCR